MADRPLATLEGLGPMYHWSPRARLGQILKYGLRTRMRPTISGAGPWPYVCFAESASWAWALSGMRDERDRDPGTWDLWQANLNGLTGEQVPTYDEQHDYHEIRVHERVYRRRIWLVASRTIPEPSSRRTR